MANVARILKSPRAISLLGQTMVVSLAGTPSACSFSQASAGAK